jgi:hypothetical protein
MSTKYLRELLESVDVLNPERAYERIGEALQELRQVEADRAKDAELIQQLVDACRTAYRAIDALNDSGMGPLTSIEGVRAMFDTVDALAAAEAAGFKPTNP